EPITQGSLKIPLSELFNFNDKYWMELWKKLAMRNLNDEMEFYELLDLDDRDIDEGNEGDITQAVV
ncbi:hypothetical protein BDQ17DRAFT_1246295, partial [Cyathus striatus]